MNVFIFHGTFGYPEENWFPWLKRQMENQGIKTYVPKFPTPKGQSLTSWLKAFKPYEKYIDKETIFVGHSLGPVFILRLLEKRKETKTRQINLRCRWRCKITSLALRTSTTPSATQPCIRYVDGQWISLGASPRGDNPGSPCQFKSHNRIPSRIPWVSGILAVKEPSKSTTSRLL